jgi:hypothetical protein
MMVTLIRMAHQKIFRTVHALILSARWAVGAWGLAAAIISAPAADAALRVAAQAGDLDVANCVAHESGRPLAGAPSAQVLEVVLGVRAGAATNAWSTPPLAGEIRRFRLAFREPVRAGTLCTEYDGAEAVATLKADAPFPGDVNDDAQWTPLPGGAAKLLPAGAPVRALRFTQRVHNLPWEEGRRASALRCAVLLAGRDWNPAQLGGHEWRRAGKADEHWLGSWPLAIAGVVLAAQPGDEAALQLAPASPDAHPAALPASAWGTNAVARAASGGPALLAFATTPPLTRGVRVVISEWQRSAQNTFAIMPLVALNAGEAAPASFISPPPFMVNYELPIDGFPAIRLAAEDGTDVRRLVAEMPRGKGLVREGWDLKDDNGAYVKPGKYVWRGLVRPPLKLTYENTVYSAGDPPWRAPVPGGGWWMADHSPPTAVTTVKDLVFLGAAGAEFGIPLIATDLEGRKVWHGDHGALRLASDGRCAYIVNNDQILRVDPANKFAVKSLHRFAYSEEIPGHGNEWIQADRSGVACREGLLVVSYNGREPAWITSVLKPGDFDLPRCFPPPGNQKVHETAYTPAEALLGSVLAITSSQQAGWKPVLGKGPLARTLVLRLKHELPVGSILLPRGDLRVYALRAGKTLPAVFDSGGKRGPSTDLAPAADDPTGGLDLGGEMDTRFDPNLWVEVKGDGSPRAGMALAARGLSTSALVFTGPKLERLDYSLVLNRRYRDAAREAELVVLEGGKTAAGGWQTARGAANPISYGDPPIAGLVWKTPTPLRGFALLEPMVRAGVAVDAWAGADDAAITPAAFKDDANWKQVFLHQQTKNHVKMNWHHHRVLHGDFGATLAVRALRVRIVEPPNMDARPVGGFGALLALQPLSTGDPELPGTFAQRLTLLQLPGADDPKPGAKVLRHLRLDQPSALAFDRDGTLFAATARGIVRIPEILKQTEPLKSEVVIPRAQLQQPRSLVFDAAGRLHALDRATAAIQVFDPQTGRHTGTIGTPGGAPLGPWDPTRFNEPSAMALDAAGKLWVVEQSFQPKRISRWTTDGKFEKEFLGPTHYGGGGVMDSGDRSVVNHLGMKFRINWADRSWKLESRFYGYSSRGMFAPDRAVYARGHRYLVGDRGSMSFGNSGPIATICEERNGIAQPLVAAGLLAGWRAFGNNAEALQTLGKLNADTTSFVWVDLNRDGVAQPGEVQVRAGKMFSSCAAIGDDLSLNFRGDGADGGWRLRVREVRADGLPVYEMASLENVRELTGAAMVNAAGETFVLGHKFLDASGKVMWRYPDNYAGVQSSYLTPWGFYNRPPGVLAGSLGPMGSFKIGNEELFGVFGNNGDQYLFTRDGLLAAAVLGGPEGFGRRFFSMPDCVPGQTDMSDLRNTVETFSGHICRAEDGNIYTIAGKNHISLLRVAGLETMPRLSGSVEVTTEDLRRTMAWAAEKARIEQALRRPAIANVPYLAKRPTIDGEIILDWPGGAPLEIRTTRDQQQRVRESWTAQLAFDETHLYVAARGYGTTPMLNRADDRELIFQGGDAFDLHLGLDPKADPKRTEAAPGDVRLVLALVKDKPAAMLYRFRAADARAGGRTFTSPVGQEKVDEIRDVTGEIEMKIVRQGGEGAHQGIWILEAAVPWKTLGAPDLRKGLVLRGDVGALVADPGGTATAMRYYWANKAHVVLSDLPSEARVLPAMWGEFRFALPDALDQAFEIPAATRDDDPLKLK